MARRRKSQEQGTKAHEASEKSAGKDQTVRERTSKRIVDRRNKNAKAKSASDDIVKDISRSGISDNTHEEIELKQSKKRKNNFKEHQVRKVSKKDASSKELKDNREVQGDVRQETLHTDSGTSKQQQMDNCKVQETDHQDSSHIKTKTTPPEKRKMNKLKKKDSQVKEEKDKAITEVKKSPIKRKQPSTRASKTKLSNEKIKIKDQKEKSPLKGTHKDKTTTASQKSVDDLEVTDDEDEEDMEWEDVAEAEVSAMNFRNIDGEASSSRSDSPSTSSNIEVTIQVPGKKKRNGKCSQEEIRKWIKRKMNQIRKESQIAAHKVHLLALLASGFRRNDLCSNSILQAVGLSLLPDQLTQRNTLKAWDISFLTRVATWFKNKAPIPGDIHTGNSEATYLVRVLEKKVYLLVVILRALGLSVRLVMSLQVLNIKLNDNEGKTVGLSKTLKTPLNKKQKMGKDGKEKQSLKKEIKPGSERSSPTKIIKGNSTPGKVSETVSRKTSRKKSRVDYSEDNERKESKYFQSEKNTSSGDSSAANSCDYLDDEQDFDVSSSKTPKRRKSSSKEPGQPDVEHEVVANIGKSTSRPKKGVDEWIEVYVEKEKKWICIDGETYSVNQPEECEKHATNPIKYIVAFDNENCIKDVTARYASGWLTSTPKLRADSEWWTETLNFYKTKNLKRDKKEDSLIKASLLRKPLPTTVSDFKNHPLYALERHLLKFEAIYPESAATLGFCRGEPVYSRDCVHTLHTRELWMKEARVVKTGEKPYKIVKGRKSRRKMLENIGEITAELFGKWQTEDYVPPPVIDGKIPRNEYGNVELFKPSMLPLGTCHIQVPGIHRLARKLNIDAVPAVVGFDFHCGFSHPVIDGVVICEENKDVLMDAWHKEQEEKIQREQQKREKRVLDNWAHLVRSLRIRERLRRKYNMEEEQNIKQETEKEQNSGETEDVTDISLSWPLNRQEGKSSRADNGHCHVFLEANNQQDAITGEWSKTCSCGHKEPL